MNEDPQVSSQQPTSRRAVLAAAAGGLGAWVASSLASAAPVAAADGDVVNVGDNLTGTKTTVFNVSSAGFSALWGNATASAGSGVGVRGDTASTSSESAGVLGIGGYNGVRAVGSDTGVQAEGGTTGVRATGVVGVSAQGTQNAVIGLANGDAALLGLSARLGAHGHSAVGLGVMGSATAAIPATVPTRTGVYGVAEGDSSSRGVIGSSPLGQGVRGEATSGVGVFGNASSAAGYAFRGSGRVRFDKVSGVATIPAGSTSVTVTPGVDVTADSFVLLTAKANIGSRSLYFSTDATNNRITIRISSSRTSSTAIAWLLLR
jgi:hypothetical protein